MIGPQSGLGVSNAATQAANNSNTRAICMTIPTWLGAFSSACRDVYSTVAADAYEWGMYGGVTPPPVRPAAGDTPQDIARQQQEVIAERERQGAHPSYPSYPGLTASEIDEDLVATQQAAEDAMRLIPYLVVGGVILAAFVVTRR